ncbi:class F sortase [Acidipropionibacterium timonense]|uniref:class F sortase n=1 Tax=Acidipropionibacterium timonense TaxID=2161818 RepID=UPI0010323706|nr:class F sortase [Acidipropionibacterium timonense]
MSQPPRPTPDHRDRRTVVATVSALAVLLVVGIVMVWVLGRGRLTTAQPHFPATPSAAASLATPSSSSPTPSPAKASSTSGAGTSGNGASDGSGSGDSGSTASCATTGGALTPSSIRIPSIGVHASVTPVGRGSDGAPKAPPLSDNENFTWYRSSAAPGSGQGLSLLMTHTYHAGGATGNAIHAGLRPGALIRVSDGSRTLCYRVSGTRKIWVSSYSSADENFIYSSSGAPRIGILICWDWNPRTREWDSREVYTATATYH